MRLEQTPASWRASAVSRKPLFATGHGCVRSKAIANTRRREPQAEGAAGGTDARQRRQGASSKKVGGPAVKRDTVAHWWQDHHEVRVVKLCFDFYLMKAKSEILVGDRAYDCDPLHDSLRRDAIDLISPRRSDRVKPPTQDRRRLRRYARRWLVERFFVWIQWQLSYPSGWVLSPKTSSALSNSLASSFCSGAFEISSKLHYQREPIREN
jgi:hypothetical protein